MSQSNALGEALAVTAAAIGALPTEHAIVIFLGASGSSAKHIAQVLQWPQADVELLRSQVTRAFVRQTRECVARLQNRS